LNEGNDVINQTATSKISQVVEYMLVEVREVGIEGTGHTRRRGRICAQMIGQPEVHSDVAWNGYYREDGSFGGRSMNV